MYVDEAFKSTYLPFPKHDINPDNKDEKWCRDWCKAIYGYYLNNRSGITPNDRSRFYELRLYADGRQNPNKYKDWLIGKNNVQEKARKGFMNVNFDDIFSPAPAYIQQIVGRFEEIDHQISVMAADPKSQTERDKAKNLTWFKKVYKNEIAAITGGSPVDAASTEPMGGVNEVGAAAPAQAGLGFEPESREDLELYASLGGFKQRYELAMETALHHSFDLSDWAETKRKMIKDFATLGCTATMDYVDKVEQKAKTKYIDILDVIIEYSHSTNFNNSRFAAIEESYTVDELLALTKLTEEELERIAAKYVGVLGNPQISDWKNNIGVADNGSAKYSSFRIPVLTTYWKTTNDNYYTERVNSRGEKWVNKEQYGKVSKSPNRKTTVGKIRTVYQAKWIIGTDHVFEYGTLKDVPRPTVNDVELPIHVYRLTGKSFVETIKPNLDGIQMTKLKLDNATAKAAPAGISIDYASLQGMTLGNNKMKPIDLLTMREQSGNIIYKATTNLGTQSGYMNSKPIQELQGGLGNALQEYIGLFEFHFNAISRLTGIDRMSLSSQTPSPDTSGKSLQIATTSTDNVLKPLYGAYLWLKEANAKNMASRIQTICMFNKDPNRGYADAIGDAGVESIKEAGQDRVVKYGIKIIAMPTEEEKADLKAAALQALNVGKNGTPLLDYGDYLFFNRMLSAGNIRYAEAYLQMRISKKEKQVQDNMQANMQVQGQQNQQLEQMKQQGLVAFDGVQTENKIKVATAESELRIREAQVLAPIRQAEKAAEDDRKIFHADHIQNTKDSAAMEREKLKASAKAAEQTTMNFDDPEPPM